MIGLVEWLGPSTGYYPGGYRQTTEMAPDGLHVQNTPNEPYAYGPTYGDANVMATNEPVEIKNGLTFYMTADSVHPAAHIIHW